MKQLKRIGEKEQSHSWKIWDMVKWRNLGDMTYNMVTVVNDTIFLKVAGKSDLKFTHIA